MFVKFSFRKFFMRFVLNTESFPVHLLLWRPWSEVKSDFGYDHARKFPGPSSPRPSPPRRGSAMRLGIPRKGTAALITPLWRYWTSLPDRAFSVRVRA